jgi:hypothetical protein
MRINEVTLDNGTTISYGFDENTGVPDLMTITIETDHECVQIHPRVWVPKPETIGGSPFATLEIDFLDDLGADEAEDDLNCGNPNCPVHGTQAAS